MSPAAVYVSRARYIEVSLFLAFFVTTIGLATTTHSSRFVIEMGRQVGVVLLIVLFFGLVWLDHGFKRSALLGVVANVGLWAFGLFLAVLNGSVDLVSPTLIRDVSLGLVFLYFLSSSDSLPVSRLMAWLVLIYGALVFLLTVIVGGFEFSYPPRFYFEYSSDLVEKNVVYSQGVSKFYVFAAIAAIYLVFKESCRWLSIGLGFFTVIFLLLSLLGGARGDSVFGLFLVLCFVFSQLSGVGRFVFLGIVVVILFLAGGAVSFEDFALYERFVALDGGIGPRQILYEQAVALLRSDGVCLTFGCGFGYFQHYYGYFAGSYPHNIFLELGIVFGVPLALLIVAASGYGVLSFLKSRVSGGGFIVLLFFYLAFIQMKSGTIVSAWLLNALAIYFVVFAISRKSSV